MGFRYRRSINLGGGVRLNVSKRGISSVSVGRPGSTLNLGRRGVRATVGLPGTGLSYTTRSAGGGFFALLGLIAAAVGSLFWLIGAAAGGSKLAQITLGGLAAFVLFASMRAPEAVRNSPSPALVSMPASPTIIAEAPPAAEPTAAPVVAPAVARSTVSVGTNAAAVMKTTTGANVRSDPSPKAKVIRQLPAGAFVEVVGSESRWVKVRTAGSDASGWVARSLLAPPNDLMSKLLEADRYPEFTEPAFDPADISAILNAAPSTR